MKRPQTLSAVALLAALTAIVGKTAWAGLLSAQGVSILDQTGGARTSFTNTESITLQQRVFNGAASSGRTVFRFQIFGPNGSQVFEHNGNAVPGSVGNAASQVSGIPISRFYTSPGNYNLQASATLDGQTVTQTASFVVSSPNILLTYPPNGARDLTDNPLTFRWISSGASRYRVTVADNPSLYNARFVQTTSASESFLTYPQNPTDALQRLTAGTVYYWQVEALDSVGNLIGVSQIPFSFSVQLVAMTKDIAVTAVEAAGAPGPGGAIPFRVTIKDQGSTSEGNFPLRFSLGGLPAPNTPVTVASMNPGDTRQYDFTASFPTGQSQSLAIACVELFDDIVINNCKTLSVTQAASSTAPASGGLSSAPMTRDQIWQAIKELLKARGISLDGFRLVGMDGSLTADELAALLDALRQGQALVNLTGPPVVHIPSQRRAQPLIPVVARPPAAQPPAPTEEKAKDLVGREWAGMAEPGPGNKIFLGSVKNGSSFKRLWSRLRDDEPPEIDFERYAVIGILANPSDRADRVEIESVQELVGKALVRYRLVVHERMLGVMGPRMAASRSRVPYLLRVIAKPEGEVQFQKAEAYNEKLNDGVR